MGENSKIEWCDHTFNPWIGCQKVSPGCDHCYAEALMDTRWRKVDWGPHGQRVLTSDSNWAKPLQWDRAAAKHGERPRVFCASLADWLDNRVSQDWRMRLGQLIVATPNLDWLLLTKRIENFAKFSPFGSALPFPSNVWIGVTAEDQEHYDRRWPILAKIPASVRFVSYEPAIGPLSMRGAALTIDWPAKIYPDWLICGGESGHGARPMYPGWARSIRDECEDLGVAFFFKQHGDWIAEAVLGTEVDVSRLPHNQAVAFGDGKTNHILYTRVGKAAAGRQLDGVEHNATPKVAS